MKSNTLHKTLCTLFLDETNEEKEKEVVGTNNLVLENFVSTNILLVEDNIVNQKLANKILQRMGHRVTLAEDGLAAVEFVSKQSFDLIFMDMEMPRMGGIEATEKIRQLGIVTPIVAMTANAYESDRERCLAAGMEGFVSKPIGRDLVQNAIETYCSMGSMSASQNQARILLFEGNDSTRKEQEKAIQKYFPLAKLRAAANGVEASILVGSFKPHIMLLDLASPDGDGEILLEYMENEPDYSNVEVIVVSELPAEDLQLQTAMDIGGYPFIQKPVDTKVLIDAIVTHTPAERRDLL